MLTWPTSLRVFACLAPTDMRKSFDGLCGIVEQHLRQNVESGQLFLFFNRRRDRVKVLQFVGDGMIIFYKRLERGTFEVPRIVPASERRDGAAAPGVEMRASDLALLLEGIDLRSVRRRRRWRRSETALSKSV
jgi:transposase